MTIKDIARLAGVSHSTVSRSLNDSPLIPAETRERIKAIASEHGFEVNASARSLSRGKTSTVALIYPEYFERPSINVFFNSILSNVREAFEREKIDVVVSFPRNHYTGESHIQKLASRRKVDGMLIIDNQIDEEDLAALAKAELPYVFLHKHPVGAAVEGADWFCCDHAAGGRLAAERLLGLGRRGFLCVSARGEEFQTRSEGFLGALAAAGIELDPGRMLYGDCSFEYGGGEALEAVLDSRKEKSDAIDAVFCETDLMALGLVQGLVRAGLRVPEDVAVVGYDDIDIASYFRPSLSTIRQPVAEISTRACSRLIALLGGKARRSPEHRLVAPTLVVRES